jgi:putative heme-binding domain-containing protein
MEHNNNILSRQNFAVELAGNYKLNSLENKIRAFIEDSTNMNIEDPDWDTFIKLRSILDLKAAALRALLQIDPENNARLMSRLLHDDQLPMELRKRAAGVLGDFPGPAVNLMLSSSKNVPVDLQGEIIMSLANTKEGKDIVFQKVRDGVFSAKMLNEPKVEERILLNSSPKQQQEFKEIIANLEPVNQEKDALIYSRLTAYHNASNGASLKDKQVLTEIGRKVFLQSCSSCHRIGNEGGSIGPNLDGIGEWGIDALTEKILDPNRNISEAFRTYTIRLKDGKVMKGLYRRDEGEVIVFADMAGKEFVIPKNEIEERVASKYTLMPDHFGKVLSQEDFIALLTYLTSQKN